MAFMVGAGRLNAGVWAALGAPFLCALPKLPITVFPSVLQDASLPIFLVVCLEIHRRIAHRVGGSYLIVGHQYASPRPGPSIQGVI